jgi:ATP-binding cassette subfamily B protein
VLTGDRLPRRTGSEGRRVLRGALAAVRREVVLCLLAGLAWQAVAVAVPAVLQRAVDDGIVDGDRSALLGWAAALTALGLACWAGDALRHWWVERSGARAAAAVRRQFSTQVLALDDDAAARIGAGQLLTRATSDVDSIWRWVAGLATLVTAAFTLGAVALALFSLGPTLAAVGLATVPLAALVAVWHIGAQRRAAAVHAATTGSLADVLAESVSGIRALKGLGAEVSQLRRVDARSAALRTASLRLARVDASWISASAFVPAAGIATGLWLGGRQALAGDLDVGALVAFAGWMVLLVDATQTLTERLATRGEARAAAERLAPVLFRQPAVSPPASARPLPRGTVEMDRVTAVRGARPVLAEVSLFVRPGEWLAVVGPTGCGKSSLLRLLPRLADPRHGAVRIGGVDVRDVAPAELRRRVAYVPQHPVLVSGTLADNLRLAAPDATDEELLQALAAVDAGDVLDRLGGFHGLLTDGGAGLSGGQRQRVALAAALVRRPDVLVLDDPTSAVDPQREPRLLDGVRDQLPGAAVLLATHRPSTAAACDRELELAGLAADRIPA